MWAPPTPSHPHPSPWRPLLPTPSPPSGPSALPGLQPGGQRHGSHGPPPPILPASSGKEHPPGSAGGVAGRLGCQARKGGASPHSAIYKKKKKNNQVVQWAPEENQVREVPVAAGASNTTTASGVRLVSEAGLAWRGPQHTLVPS